MKAKIERKIYQLQGEDLLEIMNAIKEVLYIVEALYNGSHYKETEEIEQFDF
jgi:hypothetical protein